MTRAQKSQELKELKDYVSNNKVVNAYAFESRIEWLEKNLNTKPSRESKRMAREYRVNKNSKTLSFNI